MNLVTPIYDLTRFPSVYEPREDTFLFLDALEADAIFLKQLKPMFVAEIGSGSGVVISGLHQIVGFSCAYFATDINPKCCMATKLTASLNNNHIECINMNLLSNFKEKLFDVILFNPPYVPTDAEEMEEIGLNSSWAGGENGRVIIDRFIKDLPNLLSKHGVCYIVVLKENQIEDIIKLVKSFGFQSTMVIQRKIPGEMLYVYKFFQIVET